MVSNIGGRKIIYFEKYIVEYNEDLLSLDAERRIANKHFLFCSNKHKSENKSNVLSWLLYVFLFCFWHSFKVWASLWKYWSTSSLLLRKSLWSRCFSSFQLSPFLLFCLHLIPICVLLLLTGTFFFSFSLYFLVFLLQFFCWQ